MKTQHIRYLSRQNVETINVPMIEIIKALETMFQEKAAGNTQMPPKPSIYPTEDGFIHAMPACISGLKSAGVKWVAGYRNNPARGLPYISGLLILNNAETGMPLSVMDCTWITAKRTGAATAVAAKYLARADASRLGIIACGVQGRSNLEALNCLFPLEKVYAYDIQPVAAHRYAEDVRAQYGLDVHVVRRPIEAVAGMDLVVTSGPIVKHPQPVIEAGWKPVLLPLLWILIPIGRVRLCGKLINWLQMTWLRWLTIERRGIFRIHRNHMPSWLRLSVAGNRAGSQLLKKSSP
ncbi:MAG: hypothetical protein MI862_19650 [Desulfobacterales bacterium]|nr:hypothetical protein [Desulfobacterales bacterium]